MVAVVGFEPTTPRVWTESSNQLRYTANGRDNRIWTCDLLVPNQALYQAKLHPENNGTPDRDWTYDLQFRKLTLYPLSYGCNGGVCQIRTDAYGGCSSMPYQLG